MRIIFLGLLSIFFCGNLNAQLNKIDTEELGLVTYDFGHKYVLPHAGRCFHTALEFHKKLFDYTPSEKITVLIQDFGDYGNGGATAIPVNAVSMGLAPFSYAFETSPAGERVFSMMNHELVHVVALDNSSKMDRNYHKLFFGKVKPTHDDPISMFYSYLTSPRRYSPRWYHEGIASYLETWMSGGVGLALGNYDEMVFRTRVLENARIYSAQGLESEGTTTDFQGKSNSYLYGTRFMGYLAYEYGPDKIIEWVKRRDGSKRSYAGQFKHIFGKKLEEGWSEWIAFENEFQRENIDKVRKHPITESTAITEKVLGSVSHSFYDKKRNKVYVAINYPGKVPHLAALDLANGEIEKLTDIKGAALFYVSSIVYDESQDLIFFTTDNDRWRDLNSYDLKTGKIRRLQKDFRTGDLAINQTDQSIWGIKHLNGFSTIVRMPKYKEEGESAEKNSEIGPYSSWQQMYTLPYGQDIFDIDVSPDGKKLSAAVSDYFGKQSLLMYDLTSFNQDKIKVDTIYNFEVTSPQSFRFTEDGRYLFGSAYFSGISNIFRVDVDTYEIEAMSNSLTGYFRPILIDEEKIFAYKFRSDGFQPTYIKNEIVKNVARIEYLGNLAVARHPEIKDWEVQVPTARDINIEELITKEGTYQPGKEFKLNYAYPIITGYKDFVGIGYKLNFSDPLSFKVMDLSLSYTPESWVNGITSDSSNLVLANDERYHFNYYGKSGRYSWSASYNGTDFYDLFGPTQTSRKGIAARFDYDYSLLWDPPQKLDLNLGLGGYYGLESSPFFQNVETVGFENDFYLTLNGALSYSYQKASLGAVDYEKGIKASIRSVGAFSAGNVYPTLIGTMDYGIQLPGNHFSFWLRSAAGNSFSSQVNPFTRFGFAAFGNNFIDYRSFRRYRSPYSFPGLRFDADVAIVAKEFGKILGELVIPPIRFRKLGFLDFYSNWMQPTLFVSSISYSDETSLIRNFANIGAQVDMRIVLFSLLSSTLSVGYARAFDLDNTNARYEEWMVSLKLL